MPKIKINRDLYEELKKISENAGYSSVEEFVLHLLERITDPAEIEDDDEDLVKRLQGLGYIS